MVAILGTSCSSTRLRCSPGSFPPVNATTTIVLVHTIARVLLYLSILVHTSPNWGHLWSAQPSEATVTTIAPAALLSFTNFHDFFVMTVFRNNNNNKDVSQLDSEGPVSQGLVFLALHRLCVTCNVSGESDTHLHKVSYFFVHPEIFCSKSEYFF